MLIELKVTNFAIIENLHIQFKKGLNILSGETGAGKSVLLKSLGLLMGMKGSAESIRSGSTQASIEGSFDISKRLDLKAKLTEMGIECEDDLLVVRRVISEDKSRVYLNGTLSTLQGLRDVVAPLIEVTGHTAPLIEMTGQHENRHLLSTAYHMDLLDQYAGIWEQRNTYSEKFHQLQSLKIQMLEVEKESQTKAQRLDFLIFQRDEIANLDLSHGEDTDLEIELKKLKSSNKLGAFVDQAEAALYADDDSAVSRLSAVLQKSAEVIQVDPSINEKIANLEQAKTLIEDTMYDLRQYVSKIESDPAQLERLQQRLSDLRKLQKK
jgi:DNA repair protein RecN (Recombination protein N)